MLKTATIAGQGHRSRTLLNLLASFFIRPLFETSSHHSVLFFVFSFSLLSFNSSIYSTSTISKREAIVSEKKTSRLNKLLLGNLRTNPERVILPSSRSKIRKKKTLFVDQSAFSNFCPLYYYPGIDQSTPDKSSYNIRGNLIQEVLICKSELLRVQLLIKNPPFS